MMLAIIFQRKIENKGSQMGQRKKILKREKERDIKCREESLSASVWFFQDLYC
jgi:hypothetical protein